MRMHPMLQDSGESAARYKRLASAADIVLVEGVQDDQAASAIAAAAASAPTFVAFDCAARLQSMTRLGGHPVAEPGYCLARVASLHALQQANGLL
jgi:hypothetical protein